MQMMVANAEASKAKASEAKASKRKKAAAKAMKQKEAKGTTCKKSKTKNTKGKKQRKSKSKVRESDTDTVENPDEVDEGDDEGTDTETSSVETSSGDESDSSSDATMKDAPKKPAPKGKPKPKTTLPRINYDDLIVWTPYSPSKTYGTFTSYAYDNARRRARAVGYGKNEEVKIGKKAYHAARAVWLKHVKG